jgi:riboflavin synthase
MFTGIVQELGTVARLQRSRGIVTLAVSAPKTAVRVRPLESVAVNGVCLTVVRVRDASLECEMIRETGRLTTLRSLKSGSRVNVEPSLSVTDRIGGHLVFGHVDGIGTVARRREQGGDLTLEIRVSAAMRRWLVPKGPIALDGVSLTLGQRLTGTTFSVHLIPETLRQTTLMSLKVNDQVNLEIDYLAKLVRQWLDQRPTPR